jgi:hypothetical protein
MDEAGSNKRFGIYVYLSGKTEFFCGCGKHYRFADSHKMRVSGKGRHMLSDSKWNHACISAMISMINTHLLSAFLAEFPEQNNMTY